MRTLRGGACAPARRDRKPPAAAARRSSRLLMMSIESGQCPSQGVHAFASMMKAIFTPSRRDVDKIDDADAARQVAAPSRVRSVSVARRSGLRIDDEGD